MNQAALLPQSILDLIKTLDILWWILVAVGILAIAYGWAAARRDAKPQIRTWSIKPHAVSATGTVTVVISLYLASYSA